MVFNPPGLCIQATSNGKGGLIKSSKLTIMGLWNHLCFLLVTKKNRQHHCDPLKILMKTSINLTRFS